MSDFTKTEPLDKCPSCNVRHPKRLAIPVDVTYCPKCGVPRFFEPGAAEGDVPIECLHCLHVYRPDGGGNSVVAFRQYTALHETTTPRGFLRNCRLMVAV